MQFPSTRSVFLALPTMLALVAVLGVLGCEGCRTNEPTDLGDPDKMIEQKGEKNGNGPPANGAAAAPALAPEDDAEKALAAKIEGLEFMEAQIMSNVQISRQDNREAAIQKTLAEFQKALNADPENPTKMVLLAAMFLRTGQVAEARGLYEAALEKDAEFLPAWKGIALTWAKEDEQKAVAALDRLKKAPGPWARILEAEFWTDGGKEEKAEALLLKAREELPGSAHPLLYLVRFFVEALKWEQAFHWSQKALDQHPTNQRAWFLNAQVHYAYIRFLYTQRPFPPDVARQLEDHKKLMEVALEKCWELDKESRLGKEARRQLEILRDPTKRAREAALDADRSLEERRAAALTLLQAVPDEKIFEIWTALLEDGDEKLRIIAIQGLGISGTKEGLEAVGRVAGDAKRRCLERSSAVTLVKEFGKVKGTEFKPVVVPALVAGLKAAAANFEKDPSDEKIQFLEILDTLEVWTGKHFGEGEALASAEGMERVIQRWEEWWNGQEGH